MIGDIAGIATAIAVLLAAGGLFAQVRQRKFQLEQMYVERYWTIDDDRHREHAFRHSESDRNLDRYRRLCEDEYDVVRIGWISGRTWCLWHDGIRSDAQRRGLDAGDFEHLRACLNGKAHRAWDCPGLGHLGWWRRTLTNLQALIYKDEFRKL